MHHHYTILQYSVFAYIFILPVSFILLYASMLLSSTISLQLEGLPLAFLVRQVYW